MTSTLIIVIVSYGDDTFSDTMTMITVMKRKLNKGMHGKSCSLSVRSLACKFLTLKLSDQICDSPYCQPYSSYSVSSENVELDQLILPKLIFFFILIICLLDTVLIL